MEKGRKEEGRKEGLFWLLAALEEKGKREGKEEEPPELGLLLLLFPFVRLLLEGRKEGGGDFPPSPQLEIGEGERGRKEEEIVVELSFSDTEEDLKANPSWSRF